MTKVTIGGKRVKVPTLPCIFLLISESSMFVTERRFILKTCGITTLLLAIEPLLELVKEECGFDTVAVSIVLIVTTMAIATDKAHFSSEKC